MVYSWYSLYQWYLSSLGIILFNGVFVVFFVSVVFVFTWYHLDHWCIYGIYGIYGVMVLYMDIIIMAPQYLSSLFLPQSQRDIWQQLLEKDASAHCTIATTLGILSSSHFMRIIKDAWRKLVLTNQTRYLRLMIARAFWITLMCTNHCFVFRHTMMKYKRRLGEVLWPNARMHESKLLTLHNLLDRELCRRHIRQTSWKVRRRGPPQLPGILFQSWSWVSSLYKSGVFPLSEKQQPSLSPSRTGVWWTSSVWRRWRWASWIMLWVLSQKWYCWWICHSHLHKSHV